MATFAETFADLACRKPGAAEDAAARRMRTYALDTSAVALAGSTAQSSRIVSATLLAAAGRPESTVYGFGRATSAWDAALVNGSFAHALELDDDHRVAVLHPGAVVVPAALAAAEGANASGPAFLRALLLGYEVTCRLGEVFRGSQFHHGVHPTALCGVFGAAMAAAVVMGLDREALVRALGIAGTQACGLTEWRADGSWIKRLHPGRAASNGVLAARLAKQGFTGPATIFEGANGFFNAFSFGEAIDEQALLRGLGEDWHALGTAIKPYPCCRFEHGAIDLALEAHRNGIGTRPLRKVEIRIYRTGVLTYHHEPINAVDAQFNVPYGVAVALTKGSLSLSDFTEQAIRDPQVLAAARRIQVSEDDDFSARYPQDYCVALNIELADGSEHRFFSDCPSGDPQAARYVADQGLLQAEAEQKARALLEESGFGERASPLISACEDLATSPGVDRLAAALGGPGTA